MSRINAKLTAWKEHMKKDDLKTNLLKFQSIIGLVLICVVLSFLTPRFLTVTNLFNVLRQTSLNAIMAVGLTFVILTGGIDLSVGSILAFSGVSAALVSQMGLPAPMAMIIGLLAGSGLGFINGLVITKGKVPPFIATLAMMTMARGGTLVISGGRPISGLDEGFHFIGRGMVGVVPVPVILTIITFLFAYYILTQTRQGRYIYATGSNEEAARLTGIHTDRIKLFAYTLSGFTAALAAMIIISRLGSAPPTIGDGAELDAIAAVVIGGTSLAGGIGSIFGTFIGATIIGVLNNGLNLLNVSSYYQLVVRGVVILIAVLLDRKKAD
ncbi:ABC transporter permease [Tindallia californiensis]|uniref:Ribose transport system permease protein n=1 Tax=Tindallia californiensis TaxID=159292 RepID=A0A1H3PRY4_9FIRM|nr:ribose ABC transporter permease [Tindallia californiensis]SDZ03741.1 ribose transport system permease protein [Tindallia californiensis]